MSCTIRLLTPAGQDGGALAYDPLRLALTREDGSALDPGGAASRCFAEADVAPAPLYSARILLGRGCNYRCAYCLQSPGAYRDEARPGARELEQLADGLARYARGRPGINFAFWGGEPLCYFPEMRAITQQLAERVPGCMFSVITNGSLFSREVVDFLLRYRFCVTVSHDGPAQSVRGKDPLDDPRIFALIRELKDKAACFAFNPVISRFNQDHGALVDFFTERFGAGVKFGEAAPIMPVDQASMACLIPFDKLPAYTAGLYRFALDRPRDFTQFGVYLETIRGFMAALAAGTGLRGGGKCSAVDPNALCTDVAGQVLVCHAAYTDDASAVTIFGEPGLRGSLAEPESAWRPSRAMTWEHRGGKCATCPVLYFCQGACPHMDGEHHELACVAMFHHCLPLLCFAVTLLTGKIVREVSGGFMAHLPFAAARRRMTA